MIEPYTKDIEAQMQELYDRLPEKIDVYMQGSKP